MMENVIVAILDLQDKSTYLDNSKSGYMAMVRFLFKRGSGLCKTHGTDDIENLLKMIEEYKEEVICDLNKFIESTEHLVDELNKEKGDDL